MLPPPPGLSVLCCVTLHLHLHPPILSHSSLPCFVTWETDLLGLITGRGDLLAASHRLWLVGGTRGRPAVEGERMGCFSHIPSLSVLGSSPCPLRSGVCVWGGKGCPVPQNPLLFPSPSPCRGWTRAEFLMGWGRWVRGGGEIPPASLRTVLFLSTSWRVESPASPSSSSLLGFSLQLLPLPLKPWFQLSESMPSQQGRRLPREVRLPPAIFGFVPGIRNFPRGARAETDGPGPPLAVFYLWCT